MNPVLQNPPPPPREHPPNGSLVLLIRECCISLTDLARECRASRASIYRLLDSDPCSLTPFQLEFRDRIVAALKRRQVPEARIRLALKITQEDSTVLLPQTMTHFKLKVNPFSPARVRGPQDILRTADYNFAVQRIVESAQCGEFLVLVGPQGTGKSTVLNAAITELHAKRHHLVRYLMTDANRKTGTVSAIIAAMGREVGLTYAGWELQKTQELIQAKLREHGTCRMLVILDDAHILRPDVLFELKHLWDNYMDGFRRMLSIILVAQESVYNLLSVPILVEVDTHIEKHEMLGLVSDGEVGKYIAKKLAPFGGIDHFLKPEVPGEIWTNFASEPHILKSQILQLAPRRVNDLCVRLLNIAANERHERVAAEHVRFCLEHYGR